MKVSDSHDGWSLCTSCILCVCDSFIDAPPPLDQLSGAPAPLFDACGPHTPLLRFRHFFKLLTFRQCLSLFLSLFLDCSVCCLARTRGTAAVRGRGSDPSCGLFQAAGRGSDHLLLGFCLPLPPLMSLAHTLLPILLRRALRVAPLPCCGCRVCAVVVPRPSQHPACALFFFLLGGHLKRAHFKRVGDAGHFFAAAWESGGGEGGGAMERQSRPDTHKTGVGGGRL